MLSLMTSYGQQHEKLGNGMQFRTPKANSMVYNS